MGFKLRQRKKTKILFIILAILLLVSALMCYFFAWYEIFISIIILIGSTVGIGVLSAKIYRVGVLLYGTPPRFTKIIKEVLKK